MRVRLAIYEAATISALLMNLTQAPISRRPSEYLDLLRLPSFRKAVPL
jgi:hypothetical protein